MDYKNTLTNNKGATLIYILAAFMIVSFIGVTMIKQSHHESKSSSDFSSMTTAGHAAVSGIEATKTYLENRPDSTLRILNSFFKNRNEEWILGNASNRISINNKLSYRTKLISFSFDSTNYTTDFEVTIQSEGFGLGGSQNVVTTVLKLDGLNWDQTTVTTPGATPSNALQMDNGNFEFDTEIIINGDLSCKDRLVMNTGPFAFHGKFKIDSLQTTPKTISTTTFNQNTTIDSVCYFAGPTNFASNTMTFRSNCGFEGRVTTGNASVLNFQCDTTYWNGGYASGDGNNVDLNGGRAVVFGTDADYASGSNTGDPTGLNVFDDVRPSSFQASRINIKQRLNLSNQPDPEISFNTSIIDTIYRTISTQLWSANRFTASDLNSMYNTAESKDSLWRGFLVLKFSNSGGGGAYSPFQSGTSKFNKKLIILNEDPNVRLSHFIETDTTDGIIGLYIHDYNVLTGILSTIDNFRGFIYIEQVSTGYLSIRPATGGSLNIKGSVYFSPLARSKFEGGGDPITITFEKAVMDSLAVTDIFSGTTNTTTTNIDSIIQVSDILTSTLGQQH